MVVQLGHVRFQTRLSLALAFTHRVCCKEWRLRCEITTSLAVDANNKAHAIFNANWWCFARRTAVVIIIVAADDAVAAFNINIGYCVDVVAVVRCQFSCWFLGIYTSIRRNYSIRIRCFVEKLKSKTSTSTQKRWTVQLIINEFVLHTNIIKLKTRHELSSDRSIDRTSLVDVWVHRGWCYYYRCFFAQNSYLF